ncbi:hypothetical protein BBP40_003036 [Aspergillus hancockii]|nr:hypothetical protein BBP40_003036 [Aspergillus hancockii]
MHQHAMESTKLSKKIGTYNSARENKAKADSKKRPDPPPCPESSNTSNITKSERQSIKRKDDKENPELSMDKYWSDKKASLDRPFEMPGGDYFLNDVINAKARASSASTEGITTEGLPLSNDDIANILTVAKPECHKAQAWVMGHEASKAAKERAKTKSENRDDFRKQAARQSRDKGRQTTGQSNAPRNDIRAPPVPPPPPVSEVRTAAEELGESRAVYNRFHLAHERLLKTMAGMGEFRKTLS